MIKMIYLLVVMTIVIVYQLYKVLGRSDFIPVQEEDGVFPLDDMENWEEKAQQKESLEQWSVLKKIQNTLTPQAVIDELVSVFQKIHLAFAKGSIVDVTDFLSSSVLDKFKASIAYRKGYVMHLSFVQPPQCVIKKISVDDEKNCTVNTEFNSEQIVYVENKNGMIVDNPHKLSETIKNYWIFKKNLANLSSQWHVVEMA